MIYRVSQEIVNTFGAVNSMRPIFKTKMFTYQSKANLDVEILFGKITDHLDQEIRKMLVRGLYGNQNRTWNRLSHTIVNTIYPFTPLARIFLISGSK